MFVECWKTRPYSSFYVKNQFFFLYTYYEEESVRNNYPFLPYLYFKMYFHCFCLFLQFYQLIILTFQSFQPQEKRMVTIRPLLIPSGKTDHVGDIHVYIHDVESGFDS